METTTSAVLSYGGRSVRVVGPAVQIGALVSIVSVLAGVGRENEMAEHLQRTRSRLTAIETTGEVVS